MPANLLNDLDASHLSERMIADLLRNGGINLQGKLALTRAVLIDETQIRVT